MYFCEFDVVCGMCEVVCFGGGEVDYVCVLVDVYCW